MAEISLSIRESIWKSIKIGEKVHKIYLNHLQYVLKHISKFNFFLECKCIRFSLECTIPKLNLTNQAENV